MRSSLYASASPAQAKHPRLRDVVARAAAARNSLPRPAGRAFDDTFERKPDREEHIAASPRDRRRKAGRRSLAGADEPLALPRYDGALVAVAARASTQSSTRASSETPSRRSISWTPVGLVTFTSVTSPPITSSPTK